jgi:hypothetical protein
MTKILLIVLALVVTLVASPPPIKSELPYRVSVEKGVITLADVRSGKSVSKPISEWGITVPTVPTQDRLRHLALDFTAAYVAGHGGREHTVDPNSPVYTMDEAAKAPAVTATVEHGFLFFIQRDTYTNDRYEALIGLGEVDKKGP